MTDAIATQAPTRRIDDLVDVGVMVLFLLALVAVTARLFPTLAR